MNASQKRPDSPAPLKERLLRILGQALVFVVLAGLVALYQSYQSRHIQPSEQPVSSQPYIPQGTGPDLEHLPDPLAGGLTMEDIPAYSGKASVEMNGNVPFFEKNEWTVTSFQHYFDLDDLGRVTLAYASIGPDLFPEEKRTSISSVKPTGFINHSYPFVDQEYVYNRCHRATCSFTELSS